MFCRCLVSDNGVLEELFVTKGMADGIPDEILESFETKR
jgi:hypothetical protein